MLLVHLQGCGSFFDHDGMCLSLLSLLPSPGFWLAKRTAIVLFTRFRTVGIFQINCINVLYNHAFQANKLCFMPSCVFRVEVMDVHSIQTGIFKNPL